jgi:hypothetical protein
MYNAKTVVFAINIKHMKNFVNIALLLAIFNFLDGITTYFAITYGKAIELNYYMAQLISQSWYYFFITKIIASIAFLLIGFIADKIAKYCTIPKIISFCKIFMFALTFIFVYLILHNFILFFQILAMIGVIVSDCSASSW